MGRVLIADDALYMRVVLRRILTEAGHGVVGEASDGREAVALYERLRPDLVTLDLTLPSLDGLSAAREIAERDPAARIVLFTAMDRPQLLTEALQAGVRDLIIKPFTPERVREGVRKLTG